MVLNCALGRANKCCDTESRERGIKCSNFYNKLNTQQRMKLPLPAHVLTHINVFYVNKNLFTENLEK